MAFCGLERCVPLLHGSQGCSTYIRRYMIGHFREPVDVASSNFHEQAAIFGGRDNLRLALRNVIRQYDPAVIGIATTCLAETIGDDINMFLEEFRREGEGELPPMVPVSTASYRGTHAEGFHGAVRAMLEHLAEGGERNSQVNLLSNMVSPADLRTLREMCEAFGLDGMLLPDYSDRLDGRAWEHYQRVPEGGTPLSHVRRAGAARMTLDFSGVGEDLSGGAFLASRFDVPLQRLGLPIGISATDRLMDALAELAGREVPESYTAQRGRLVDAYVDGHKYLFERKAVLYGEEDLVVALTGFLAEIGMLPALVATGSRTGRLGSRIAEVAPELPDSIQVLEDVDFVEITDRAKTVAPDLILGNSNGYKLSRELGIPLVRVGLPIHDRMGAARVRTLGYGGTQDLFDRICNTIIATQQDASPVGYTHM
jgi:nitrogenase molybdenum-iron protein NifN